MTVQASGRVGFTDGRHRYAWLRDQGITSIPVSMTPESAKYAKKYGLLAAVKKAWDESQHPRDKEGQFTETVYHGTGQDFPTFDLARGGEATGAKNGVLGAFFTTDVVKAGDLYAGRRGTLMEARLKLTNPARFRGQEYENDASATVNSETAAYVEKPLDDLTEDDFREWRDFLIRQGHDGIEVRLHHGETDYIVFNVAQIVRYKAGTCLWQHPDPDCPYQFRRPESEHGPRGHPRGSSDGHREGCGSKPRHGALRVVERGSGPSAVLHCPSGAV